MLPFTIDLKLGLPLTEQILFAVKKAVANGQLRPGDKFPSTRTLSQELRINPNTAQKAIAALVTEGVLLTTPAVGSIVAEQQERGRQKTILLLATELEHLVVEAKRMGISEDDLLAAVSAHWKKLSHSAREFSHR